MKRYIIILVLLMTFYPFIGGQKGCGGSGGIEIADQPYEIDTTSQTGVSLEEYQQVLVEEGEGAVGESGPANMVLKEPEKEDEPGKPEKPKKPEKPLPSCINELPPNADIYMIIDVGQSFEYAADIKSIGAFDTLLDRIKKGIENLAPDADPSDLVDKMDSVCFACKLKEGRGVLRSQELADNVGSTTDKFGFDSCEELVFVDVFKEPFPLEGALLAAGRDIHKDSEGNIELTEKLLGVQAADNVIVVRTKVSEGNISPDEANLLASTLPTTIGILATNVGMSSFMGDAIIDYFRPMFSFIKFDFESRILSALYFAKRVGMGTKIFDMEKLKAGEDALVMKMFLEMAYDEFQFLMKSLSEKDAKEVPHMEDVVSGTAVGSESNVIGGTAVGSESNVVGGTAVESE